MTVEGQLTNGECHALIAQIAGIPMERIASFGLVLILECASEHPCDALHVMVTGAVSQPMEMVSILSYGIEHVSMGVLSQETPS